MMTRTATRAALGLAGIIVLTAGFWAGRSLAPSDVTPAVQTGTVRFVGYGADEFLLRQTATNQTISFALPDPVSWRNAFGSWFQSARPSCMRPYSHGQRITIGVVNVAPAGDAPGGPVVVWVECAAKPIPRYPIVSPSASP